MQLLAMLCLITAQAPQSVALSNIRFVNENQVSVSVVAGTVLVGGTPGDLYADFAFQSPFLDPVSGRYVVPRLATLWSLRNPEAISTEPEGAWLGLRRPLPDVYVKTFDDLTGQGIAEAVVPIGRSVDISTSYPHFPQGQFSINVVFGLRNALGEDGSGEPVNVLWQASTSLAAAWPDVWVGCTSAIAFPNDSSPAVVRLLEPAAAPRTFTIDSTVPGVVTIPNPVVTIAQGALSAVVAVSTVEPGRFRLRLTESGQVPVTSPRCVVLADVFEMDATQGSGGGPGGPDFPVGNWKECYPAQPATGVSTFSKCSPCVPTSQTASVNCHSTVNAVIPARCEFILFPMVCFMDTSSVQSLTYTSGQNYIVSCLDLTGGFTFPSGGVGYSLKWHKQCCDYTSNGSPPVSISVRDCHN